MAANQRGQAIFEFIIFLPVMLILYGIIIQLAAAINGSINQQKATRGYTYGAIKGNPTIPPRELIEINNQGEDIASQGMLVYLYAQEVTAGSEPSPYTTCYKVSSFGQGEAEQCEEILDKTDQSSPLIRVKTGYGLCGATYTMDDQQRIRLSSPSLWSTQQGCLVNKP